MSSRGISRHHARGFTLVELIVVIVILGILAVSAAPKYMNLTGDARAAVLKGMMGSIRSANNMVYAKAIMRSSNLAYSEHESSDSTWYEDCRHGNCVQIGDTWVYLKYAYVDRNSVAFILDADISGQQTKTVTNPTTNQKIKIPNRGTKLGQLNYTCTNAGDTLCTGSDFCQCRKGNDKVNGQTRDSQVIVPNGFPYNINKHTNGGCYFKYTSAEYVNEKREPPVYTLATSGC